MKNKQAINKLSFILASVIAVVVALSWIFSFAQVTVAQGTEQIFVDKQLGRSDPLVHVGEYLTFTILIDNSTSFTVTTLPLSDTFNTDVLAYVDAVPPPDSVDEGAGRLDWNDLTTFFGDLAPGQQVTVVVGFIAEHPAPAVVNAAEVHDAAGSGGQVGGNNDSSGDGESVGGSSPVDKSLIGDIIPQVGQPLTFTIVITNNGFTTMTVVPLVEDYDPAFLQFSYAIPQPDVVDEVSGELMWSDLTVWSGDIPAHQAITVTAVFTPLAPIDVTSNSASVSGASDWYGNEMGAGGDQVPITIIGQGGATPTPTGTATATSVAATATPEAPATRRPEATATPVVATVTPTSAPQIPAQIPDTGILPQQPTPLTLVMAPVAATLPVAAWLILRRAGRHE